MASVSSSSAEVALHRRLVEAAIWAPTPDNNQPWRFVSRGDRLEVYLDPARALPSDVHSMFDLIGLGAAIENIRIAAGEVGHVASVRCADGLADATVADGRLPAATVRLSSGGRRGPLVDAIGSRCTCRRLYSTEPIERATLAELTASASDGLEVQVDWATERRAIRELAAIVAATDRIRLEYEPFHAELFRQLRFSRDDVESTRDGLDVRTLELPPGGATMLRSLRRWRRMRLVHRVGLGRALALPSWLSVRRSGAIGMVSVERPSTKAFVEGGRTLQRLWLAAHTRQLALQPLGSLPIFLAHVEQLGAVKLAEHHAARVEVLRNRFSRLMPTLVGRTLLMLFRLGHARGPRHRSLRRPVEAVFEIDTTEPPTDREESR